MSNERTKEFLRRVATEATILATDANKTGTILTMSEQLSRRDFLKLAGLGSAAAAALNACKKLGINPDNVTTSTQIPDQVLPNFYDASPKLDLFLTEQIVGRLTVVEEIETEALQRYIPVIDTALEKQWGVKTQNLETVLIDGIKIIDHTGISEIHYPLVWVENKNIITGTNGEPLSAVNLLVGFNPDLSLFVPPNELKDNKLMGKLFPLVFASTPTNIYAGIGEYKGVGNEYEMTIPMFNYSLKDKTLKIFDPYSSRDIEIDSDKNPIEIEKPKKVLASLVPVTEVFLKLENQFKESVIYSLNRIGEIEMDTGDGGTKIVPDIQVHPDGTMTFTHEGQEFQADPDSLEVNGQTISFKDQDGKTWVFDGKELAQAPEYLSSADGTVLWTKEGMSNGELRVKDEKAKELRNDTLKALWAVNNALVNPAYINDTPQEIIDDHKAFLAKFPTANALINYVENGGEPVDFIYIPVNNSQALSARHLPTAMIQKIENIDLSKIIIGFDILPKSELSGTLSLDEQIPLAIDSPYVEFEWDAGQLLVAPVTLQNNQIVLSWKFRTLFDVEANQKYAFGRLSLYQEQIPADKLSGATVLVRSGLDITADLLPKHTEINKAINPSVLISYYNLYYKYNISSSKPVYETYHKKASDLSQSYFGLP